MPRGAYDTTFQFTTPHHHYACPNQDEVCALGELHPDYQVCTDYHGLLNAFQNSSPPRATRITPVYSDHPPALPHQEKHLSEEKDDHGYFEEAYSQYRLD